MGASASCEGQNQHRETSFSRLSLLMARWDAQGSMHPMIKNALDPRAQR